MDALISTGSYEPTPDSDISRVWFGGSYEEHWSDDYKLLVSYHNRRAVEARFTGGRWQPVGGDPELCEALLQPDCPVFLRRYFSTAAGTYAATLDCRRRGLPLTRLYECFPQLYDALAAPELLRLLMDDCGYAWETALPLTLLCAGGKSLGEDEIEALAFLQPRTAEVARFMQSKRAELPVARYDARRREYRRPSGALRSGEQAEFSFTLVGGTVEAAYLILRGDSFRSEIPMRRSGDRFSVVFSAPEQEQALWYYFRLDHLRGSAYLGPDETGFFGKMLSTEPLGFRLTVFRSDFDTPSWFRKSVMYQIFPDRFAFSEDGTAERGIAYHERLGQHPELHRDRGESVRWQARDFEASYAPDDFYGGTLRGILAKLPYLSELGVGVIYLNPIVEARSNHRYDASDYTRVDPILGTQEDFEELCREAEKRGIRVMLDGVFSHTGADSIYFNRYGSYPSLGACQGSSSPYYSWYDFRRFPSSYRCWWGFEDLPEVNELDEEWQRFVISDPESVVRLWLRRGAAGWRLDVADELPDEVLCLIREAAKKEKPDAPILGEVWEDAIIKESYGARRKYALGSALDSVMNYPLRTALLDFAQQRLDAYGLRDFLVSQQLNYPRPMYYSLMNLLGTHDVERLLTTLALPFRIKDLPRESQLALRIKESDIKLARRRELLCTALQFALPGVPSIYYGDEQGMRGGGDPFNRRPFREGDTALHDYYAELSARRNRNDALKTGHAAFHACSQNVLLVLRYIVDGRDVFGEKAENGAWLLAVNRSETEERFSLRLDAIGRKPISGLLGPLEARFVQLL